jgi:hypothetical protein
MRSALQGGGALGLAALLFALDFLGVALVLLFERLQIVFQIIEIAHAQLLVSPQACTERGTLDRKKSRRQAHSSC